jgi:O-antigen ligase
MTMTSFSTRAGAGAADKVEVAGFAALIGFVAAVQFSIAAAQILLTVAIVCWIVVAILNREHLEAPSMFWPLVAYAVLTLVSTAFSLDPMSSIWRGRQPTGETKQLLLFLVVPLVYRLARGPRTSTVVWVVITAGAVSAAVGILQYGIFEFDLLGSRLRGTLGHWMTYSGLLMLVSVVALARALFRRRDRAWPMLVMPALIVALALTQTRSAWVGLSVAVGLLLLLKDVRLVGLLPVVVAIVIGFAPQSVTNRFYSIFDPNDPTSRDRVSMLRAGVRIVRDHPLTGVGPNVVGRVYPIYRDPDAIKKDQPHLHNVVVQIAAERGLLALGAWFWFIGTLAVQTGRKFRAGGRGVLPAAGLGAIVAMLAAGMFEHNFGDSEFLMLFLVIVTLPYAAEWDPRGQRQDARAASIAA